MNPRGYPVPLPARKVKQSPAPSPTHHRQISPYVSLCVYQGARGASAAESERAALSLEFSTADARARELMLMLDERQQEADALRRALAAKECEREVSFTVTVMW